ncbi:MAG: PIN/TRAM domain-containing protein [Pirellulaceae bacterium]
MSIWIIRGIFLIAALGASISLLTGYENVNWIIVPATLVGAVLLVGADMLLKKKRIDLISSIIFGLVLGLFITFVFDLALAPVLQRPVEDPSTQASLQTARLVLLVLSALAACYVCISFLWQTKDDFRFIIPYVEFAKETKGVKPYILDTSVVIDGRIADIVETGIIDNPLVMPRFVLAELQNIADSSDKLRRARGRRGLDVLNRLRSNNTIDLQVYERELPEMDGESVDAKLLILAKHLEGKVVTGDFNLNKVAKLQNVEVINLNEIANSIKPVFLPGESINVKIVKAGEEAGQGIGYLDDGTMVVVEDGRGQIGNSVEITVTSMLQTSAGRMVFGRYNSRAR